MDELSPSQSAHIRARRLQKLITIAPVNSLVESRTGGNFPNSTPARESFTYCAQFRVALWDLNQCRTRSRPAPFPRVRNFIRSVSSLV